MSLGNFTSFSVAGRFAKNSLACSLVITWSYGSILSLGEMNPCLAERMITSGVPAGLAFDRNVWKNTPLYKSIAGAASLPFRSQHGISTRRLVAGKSAAGCLLLTTSGTGCTAAGFSTPCVCSYSRSARRRRSSAPLTSCCGWALEYSSSFLARRISAGSCAGCFAALGVGVIDCTSVTKRAYFGGCAPLINDTSSFLTRHTCIGVFSSVARCNSR